MLVQDISFPSPQENILYDEVLLRLAEEGASTEALRFWESEQLFIVLGRIGKVEEDIQIKTVHRDHIPVMRRSSGGGTVLQGRGCLNYSLVLSKELNPEVNDLRKSYQFILTKVIAALKPLGVESEFHPISDIALAGQQKKISGNAQHRGRKFILHHGTILYDFDLSLIEKYLKMPISIPEYRRGRSHLDFVANAALLPDQFKRSLAGAFNAEEEISPVSPQQKESLRSLLKARHPAVALEEFLI